MAKRKVVLTGAADYLGGRMLPALQERYDLTLLDVKTTNRDGEEVEGFVFATGSMNGGKRLENVQVRVGAPRETVVDDARSDDLKRLHRELGAYLSVRDQVQLVVKSIETGHIEDKHGVPFQIFYGISGNSHNFWSIANARKVIGYEPEDNSQIRFAERVGRVIREARKGYREGEHEEHEGNHEGHEKNTKGHGEKPST